MKERTFPVVGAAPTRLSGVATRLSVQVLLLAILLALAALPRLLGLADFLTTDEAYHWIDRVERFSTALSERRWAGTSLTGHPGVTTMWLGSAGLALERAAIAQGWAAVDTRVEHLAWLRFPGALLQSLVVPLAYVLLRRLVSPLIALLAAALWAASPYLIAHSRLLHLDAQLTTWVTFSLLALLVSTQVPADQRGWRTAVSWRWLLLSGGCAGLALLTKGPALILLPFAGLTLFWRVTASDLAQRMARSVALYLAWLAVAALVVFALWPVLWVDAPGALLNYVEEIRSNGGRPNGDGQFFLGRAVADPGPLFYLLASLFRTTPLELLGLLLLPLLVLRRSLLPVAERRHLLALGAFVLFWTLVMTLGPKKFDRYVLPAWPALLVLAAAGLAQLSDLLRHVRLARSGAALAAGLASLALLIGQPVIYHPYYLSYYNPLLGGGAVAQRLFLIGWGEGMDQVGALLSERSDISYGPVLSALGPTLQPFVPVPVKDVDQLGRDPANYAVAYLESIQRGANPEIYAEIRKTPPVAQATIHGIEYATIHQLPRPYERPIDATFADSIHLWGVTVTEQPSQLIVTPSWGVLTRPAADYRLFVHVLDLQGNRVAQADVAPGGASAPPTSAWRPGEQIALPIDLALPAGLAEGEYLLVLGLYDPVSGARLPFTGGWSANEQLAGPHALLVDRLRR